MPEHSSLSPILDWPRRRSLGYPTQASTRPICIAQNRPARPQQAADPAQRPRTVRAGVTLPRKRIVRGAQIPIAHRGRPTRSIPAVSSLGGLRTPAPGVRRATIMGPASANLHNRVVFTLCQLLPVFPYKQTFSGPSAFQDLRRCNTIMTASGASFFLNLESNQHAIASVVRFRS